MNKHIDDTRYVQWEDGMYVMLDDLECDYEKALVEDSLRDSRYFNPKRNFFTNHYEACLAVNRRYWWSDELSRQLTRAQALYIATGETTCTTS
tara:strand:- start:350 stop:628 length:279 start_codon:yes stop_codon:yes gene_type:complete